MSGGDNNEYNAYWYNWKRVEGELAELRAGKRSFKGHGVGSDLGGGGFKAPLTWDFDKLLANVGKTETEKNIVADYVSVKPVIDGNLNDKIWQDAQKGNLELFQNPGSRIPDDAVTQLALAYDDENLYVGFWCREPETGKMKLMEVGRDGYVYGLEEVEALFDPENSYKKFMHFMAAPFQNAFYDERCGYKVNELDPENRDVEWNPEWKYGFSIDKEKGMWYMEMSIPFKSLGMKTPVSGTVLRANFARVRRVNSALELSCWASGSFCDAGKFGEIEFREKGEKKKLLIRNGSFEETNEKGYPDDWNIDFIPEKLKACFSVTEENAHTGKKALKIDFNVKFLASISRKELVRLIKSSNIFSLPSLVEGFGIATIEACCAGLPYVISDIEAHKEVTKGGQGGFLIDSNEPLLFSKRFYELLTGKSLYSRKSKQAKKLSELYNWQKVAKDTEEIYKKLL